MAKHSVRSAETQASARSAAAWALIGPATSRAACSSVPLAITSRVPPSTEVAVAASRSSASTAVRCRVAAIPSVATNSRKPSRNGGTISRVTTGAMDSRPSTTPMTVTRKPRTITISPA